MNLRRPDVGLGTLLEERSLAVVAGSGGVGKTTVSAALGLAATNHVEGDVLVLTIDPARRLASALGIAIDGNAAVQIQTPRVNGRRKPRSRVFAAMLDPGPAWDAMIRADAAPEVADRIIGNPVYRRIADTFVHGNDYAALGWLAEVLATERYRLIIVDTPPSQNALDFFDAPRRVEEFFGSSLLGWLTGGDGSLVGGAAAKTFATLADKLLGDKFFADVVEFFQLMRGVVPSMVESTTAVAAELGGDDAAFIAVTAPSRESADRLMQLAELLSSRDLEIDAVVANGVEPDVFWRSKTLDVAERIAHNERSPLSSRSTELFAPGAEYVVERCNVAAAQNQVIESLPTSIVATVPRQVHSPAAIPDLLELGELLWSGSQADS